MNIKKIAGILFTAMSGLLPADSHAVITSCDSFEDKSIVNIAADHQQKINKKKNYILNLELARAAANGEDNNVRDLIKQGADVNALITIDDWFSPLILASRCNRVSTVDLLIKHGADVNLKANGFLDNLLIQGSTALVWAAAAGNLEIVKLLLSVHADPNAHEVLITTSNASNKHGDLGRTALLASGSVEITKALLELGANPNYRGADGYTRLMIASAIGNVEECRLLLAHGAKKNIKNKEGLTAADIAIKNGFYDLAQKVLN